MVVITMVSTIHTIPKPTAPRSEAPVLHVPDGVVVFGSLSGSWAWMGVAIGQSIVSVKWERGVSQLCDSLSLNEFNIYSLTWFNEALNFRLVNCFHLCRCDHITKHAQE